MKSKKLLSFLIAVMMLLTMLPATAVCAAEADAVADETPEIGELGIVEKNSAPKFTTQEGKNRVLKAVEDYPEAYDLRDEDCVTSIKFQNPFGTCWGFAAISAAETSILGSGLAAQEEYDASTLDLSEKHLAYFAASSIEDPSDPQYGEGTHHWDGVESSELFNIGGLPIMATNAFASGIGPVNENVSTDFVYRGKEGKKDVYFLDGIFQALCYSAEDDWSLDDDERFVQTYVLSESYMLPSPYTFDDDDNYTYNPAGTAAIKEQVYAKRGVEIGFCADVSQPDQETGDAMYISAEWAHYTWQPEEANHAVQIIGWDDNYPKENFVKGHQPPENGAWLVKNSWGSAEEEFPNRGYGDWGLLNGQDKGVYNEETGKYEYNAQENAAHTGYFWLSYYDQSITLVEALSFDKANQDHGYYLDEHDYMQVAEMLSSRLENEAKISNVFHADVCEQLNEVSCETTFPDTHVTYEVYLLQSDFQDPEDGVLVARMEDDYRFGGFHKKPVEAAEGYPSDNIIIQKGQYYSIVSTQEVADGTYAVNTPVGEGDSENNAHYAVGVINEKESYIMLNGEWLDYSDEDVRLLVFDSTDYNKPSFDNFPIKGFCTEVGYGGRDLEIRLTGSKNLPIFRNRRYNFGVRMIGGIEADIPRNPKITWALSEGGDELIDLKPREDYSGAYATLKPKKEGETYLAVTVEGVGTTVIKLKTTRMSPGVVQFKEQDDQHRPLGWAYTGEAIEPEIDVYTDSDLGTKLQKDKEYTAEYTENVLCGVGFVTVSGAGELSQDPEAAVIEPFPILPAQAQITGVAEELNQITVSVADQKASGITGYAVQYRALGEEEWQEKRFSADSAELTLTDLPSSQQYELRVCGYVDIPQEKQGQTIEACYTGAFSDTVTSGMVPGAILGDADGDGEVTVLDATAIERVLAELKVPGYCEAAADADGDGSVTILDSTAIRRWLAELPTNENIGKPII